MGSAGEGPASPKRDAGYDIAETPKPHVAVGEERAVGYYTSKTIASISLPLPVRPSSWNFARRSRRNMDP